MPYQQLYNFQSSKNRFFVITSYYVIAASSNFSERNKVTYGIRWASSIAFITHRIYVIMRQSFNFVKMIFFENPLVTWPKFFDFWLNFYCKSDDIVEILKSKLFNILGIKFETNQNQLYFYYLLREDTKTSYKNNFNSRYLSLHLFCQTSIVTKSIISATKFLISKFFDDLYENRRSNYDHWKGVGIS